MKTLPWKACASSGNAFGDLVQLLQLLHGSRRTLPESTRHAPLPSFTTRLGADRIVEKLRCPARSRFARYRYRLREMAGEEIQSPDGQFSGFLCSAGDGRSAADGRCRNRSSAAR